MARRDESRTRFVVGIFIVAMSVIAFVSLFVIGQSEGTWKRKTKIHTDFRTITGLRKGSPVQLAGVEVGNVEAINFVTRTAEHYKCDPISEDVGRFGAGRTNNCDEFLFCSPQEACAELEPYASKAIHRPCLSSEDCSDDEICITKDFRRKARRVFWAGPNGVCARYTTDHRRVEVTMSVFEENLDIIRSDSHATVASNGVLGDQLVNITPGSREPLGEKWSERRIQSTPSLYEDIEVFRDRIDGLTDKVDGALSGIANLFSELNDQRTIASLKGTIEYANEISRQIAEGEGLVHALLSDEQYKGDFGKTLRSVRNTAQGVDTFVGRANQSLSKIDDNLQPAVDDARKVMSDIRGTLSGLRDPANKSIAAKLLYDKEGKWTNEVEKILSNAESATAKAAKIAQKVEDGEGTLGKLVNDPKIHDEFVKVFRDLERNNTFKSVTRYIMDMDDAGPKRGGAAAKRKTGN